MLFTLLFVLIPIIQVGMPLYLIYRIWKSDFENQASWLIWAVHVVLAIAMFFVVFRWDIVGYGARYWLSTIYILVIAVSYLKINDLPFYQRKKLKWSWGQLLEILLLVVILGWSFWGFETEQEEVDLEYPLKGQSNYVIHGGNSIALNYHGIVDQQKFALDIVGLNDWGFRANGLLPDQLNEYAIFGKTVYSPLSGTIVSATDSLQDQTPPQRFPEKPTGNHIWIKNDSLYVVLAHLKQGSIKVEEGDNVKVNQPIAKVGNTGNTTEPHLHVHGVRFPKNKNPQPDSLLYKGKAVPLTFGGQFLIRNSIF